MGKKRFQTRFWGRGDIFWIFVPGPDFCLWNRGGGVSEIWGRKILSEPISTARGGAGWDTTPAPERPFNGLKNPRGVLSGVAPVASSGAMI